VKKSKVSWWLGSLLFVLSGCCSAFAAEEFTITTYYPSPHGSYRELTASDRMAIGDVNRDGSVDARDLPVYMEPINGSNWSNTGDPATGSLSIANRLVVGRTNIFPNARVHIHSSHEWENDIASIALSTDRMDGWVNQFWWLDETGDWVKHVLAMDRDQNDQLFLYLNYDGYYHGANNANSTFAILHGNVGINTRDAGAYRLAVTGDTNLNGRLDITGNVQVNGSGTVSNTWCANSDVRLKKDIRELTGVLPKLETLQAVTFDWNTRDFPRKGFSQGRQIGIVAQSAEKEFPELVKTGMDGYKSFDYQKFAAVLLEAVKEQQKEIESLKNEINSLKKSRR